MANVAASAVNHQPLHPPFGSGLIDDEH